MNELLGIMLPIMLGCLISFCIGHYVGKLEVCPPPPPIERCSLELPEPQVNGIDAYHATGPY